MMIDQKLFSSILLSIRVGSPTICSMILHLLLRLDILLRGLFLSGKIVKQKVALMFTPDSKAASKEVVITADQ